MTRQNRVLETKAYSVAEAAYIPRASHHLLAGRLLKLRNFCVGCSLVLACAFSHAQSENEIRDEIHKSVWKAWTEEKYDALDNMAEEYASTQSRTKSGKWRLAVYMDSLDQQFQIQWPKEYDRITSVSPCKCWVPDPKYYSKADALWAVIDRKTMAWVNSHPKSVHAAVARASYLLRRGWFYRGSGYAESVPGEAWPILRSYEQQARELLTSYRSLNGSDPAWFEEMFEVVADLPTSPAEYRSLVQEFKTRGHYYQSALDVIFNYLQPKWGGSIEEMDQFAREITSLTRAQEGGAMYARLYWNIASQYPRTLFTQTMADWPTMRAGLRDLHSKYPDPRSVNALGTFACMAGDFATLDEVLSSLGDSVDKEQWALYLPYDECILVRDTVRAQQKKS